MNHIHRRLYPLASIAAGVVTLAAALPASAIDLTNADGTWKFSLNGNVNVDYIYSNCEKASKVAPVVTVGGACTGDASGNSVSSIANGLLPAAFVFGVSTTQDGIDLAAHLGLYPGIATNDGGSPNLQQTAGGNPNVGLGTTGLDLRQVYMTFGNKDMGTFTLGRNFGLFGFDAIINDMTLIGVGVGGGASGPSPANTTLGSIGFGYIYVDTLAQMNYTTPDFSGANLTVGIFEPVNSLTEPGIPAAKSAPGFHGKIAWSGKFGDDMKLSLSATGIEQKQDYDLSATTAGSFRSVGGDVFAKLDVGSLSLTASGYDGKGMGTTGLYFLADDGHGNARPSYGYLLQGTYAIQQVKFGVNYGVSRLAFANAADRAAVPDLLAENAKVTGGVYYSLTKNLTLLGEVSRVWTIAHNDGENKSTDVNVGAFLAF
jgi:predicted porin